ncbi:MAG TPA: ROK family protein, partial [Sphingomonadaceae bacterium]|nr:ROK family protein [Sphingomonadaceae bacterium]
DQATPDNVARLIRDFTASVAAPGFDRASLCGVGIALPGDFIRGADLINPHAYFPDLRSPGSVRRLAEGIDLPVFVENDAASAALGERLMGAGQGIEDFLFVHLGHGIGGALVQGGSLYRGFHGNAGMIGIRFPNDRPRPSGQDLFAHLAQSGIEVSDFPELEKLTATTCPPLKAWIRRAGAQLRQELALTARVFDPAAIIIGGRLPLAMLNALVSEIDTAEFCDEGVGLPRPRVLASQLGIRAGMIGSASLPIVRLLMGRGAPHDDRDLPGLALDRPADAQL